MSPLQYIYGNERGAILVVALAFLVVLSLLGTTAVITTTTDMKIGANYRAYEQAFYEAEGGVEEVRGRMRNNSPNKIPDSDPTGVGWRYYIGDPTRCAAIGYQSVNPDHHQTVSIESDPDLSYVVEIRHATDSGGNILYWGDTDGDGDQERNTTTGDNIYVIMSYGSQGNATKTLRVEITRLPPITVPAALYVEAATVIQGSSTNVLGADVSGADPCGGSPVAGLATTLDASSVTENGNPVIAGVNSPNPPPSDIVDNVPDQDVQAMINAYKPFATFPTYVVNSDTHTATTTPGPGDGWGSPVLGATLQDPSSCGTYNIIHYDTQGTYIHLSGGVQGCGLLLVEGDLDIHGDFSWYGVILVSGSVFFTGGGNKQVTGAVLAGGSVVGDVVGGNANIVYCSDAVSDQFVNNVFRRLTWYETMTE